MLQATSPSIVVYVPFQSKVVGRRGLPWRQKRLSYVCTRCPAGWQRLFELSVFVSHINYVLATVCCKLRLARNALYCKDLRTAISRESYSHRVVRTNVKATPECLRYHEVKRSIDRRFSDDQYGLVIAMLGVFQANI